MSVIRRLMAFLDGCPTPYHAAGAMAGVLTGAGFTRLDPARPWGAEALGPALVVVDGALIAWGNAAGSAHRPFRIIGAHTDSPNLRVRPVPDTGTEGYRQLAVEPYGGLLANSWLDRDLGLAGRVVLAADDSARSVLYRSDAPLLRIPQLAIHLDREVNERGLVLDRQRHLTPVWGLGQPREGDLRIWLADALGVGAHEVLSWDLMTFDHAGAALLGADAEFLASGRLDNLVSCDAAVAALTEVASALEPPPAVPVVACFDHEEVGSDSATGAAGPLLERVLERLVAARGGGRDDLAAALAGSWCLSADMAHAVHPNHPERHEPLHRVRSGGGPVLKVNVNQRYATGATGSAMVMAAAQTAGVSLQHYSHRGDLPCGSTIGPLTAARLGLHTVDVGAPMLAMHSARETMAAADVEPYGALMAAWWYAPGPD